MGVIGPREDAHEPPGALVRLEACRLAQEVRCGRELAQKRSGLQVGRPVEATGVAVDGVEQHELRILIELGDLCGRQVLAIRLLGEDGLDPLRRLDELSVVVAQELPADDEVDGETEAQEDEAQDDAVPESQARSKRLGSQAQAGSRST